MYLIIGEIPEEETPTTYTVKRRTITRDKDTLTFYGVTPDPGTVTEPVKMYRGDGFLLSEDTVSGYARQTYDGGTLVFTNEPEPEPPGPTPEPEPTDTEVLNVLLGVSE